MLHHTAWPNSVPDLAANRAEWKEKKVVFAHSGGTETKLPVIPPHSTDQKISKLSLEPQFLQISSNARYSPEARATQCFHLLSQSC
jgi:hypothetical protein